METLDIGECNVILATGVASESYHMYSSIEDVANRDRYVCVHVCVGSAPYGHFNGLWCS